jgi:hypothetical protein
MRRYLLLSMVIGVLSWILASGCSGPSSRPDHETDCTNLIDDDGDSMVDCDDPDCQDHVACARETDCDDEVDNDRDGEVDCDDPDCDGAAACNETPDGDADEDTDEDEDPDVVEDADQGETVNGGCCGEITLGPECATDCSADPYFNRCEQGVCTNDGTRRDCCVSTFCTCCATLTVAGVREDLQINYRGMYSNNHQCGFDGPFFVVQSRGLACDAGFIRIQARVPWGVLMVGESRPLCDDISLADMQIMATVTDLEGTQVNYQNRECPRAGTLTLIEIDDEALRFRMEGSLSELDTDYRPTGRTVDIDLEAFAIRRAEL